MALTVEWRTSGGTDSILMVDDAGMSVSEAAAPNAELIRDYLDVTGDLERWRRWSEWRAVDGDEGDPDAWGALVLGRADDGQVIFADPELYWDGVRQWFYARGGNAKP